MTKVNIAADLGESFGAYSLGADPVLMEVIGSANIACGFHAGDPVVMNRTVEDCVSRGIEVGAQPGFHDLYGFGRRDIQLSWDELYAETLYQIGALSAFAAAHQARVAHVSPHGRLGNLVRTSRLHASAVATAVAAVDPSLIILGMSGVVHEEAERVGVRSAIVALADRGYDQKGRLLDRSEPGSVHDDPEQVARQAIGLATGQPFPAVGGGTTVVPCQSVLLHGDNPHVEANVAAVRDAVASAGLEVVGLEELLGTS